MTSSPLHRHDLHGRRPVGRDQRRRLNEPAQIDRLGLQDGKQHSRPDRGCLHGGREHDRPGPVVGSDCLHSFEHALVDTEPAAQVPRTIGSCDATRSPAGRFLSDRPGSPRRAARRRARQRNRYRGHHLRVPGLSLPHADEIRRHGGRPRHPAQRRLRRQDALRQDGQGLRLDAARQRLVVPVEDDAVRPDARRDEGS